MPCTAVFRDEFAVDVDMLESLRGKAVEEAERTRAQASRGYCCLLHGQSSRLPLLIVQIAFENNGRELIRERIKHQCWDDMEIKG